MCQVLLYIQWCKSEQDRLLSLMALMFWLIIYMTQLTCLKVRLLTCEVRVTITHRACMEFKWDNECVTGCKNGTLHASWGMNSTDVTLLHSKVNWKQNTMEKITGYMTITKCAYKGVSGVVIHEDPAVGLLGRTTGLMRLQGVGVWKESFKITMRFEGCPCCWEGDTSMGAYHAWES